MKKMSEIVGTMSSMSNKTTIEDLKQGLSGVIGTIGNSLIVKIFFFSKILTNFNNVHFVKGMSSPLNSRSSFIKNSIETTNQTGKKSLKFEMKKKLKIYFYLQYLDSKGSFKEKVGTLR